MERDPSLFDLTGTQLVHGLHYEAYFMDCCVRGWAYMGRFEHYLDKINEEDDACWISMEQVPVNCDPDAVFTNGKIDHARWGGTVFRVVSGSPL